MLINTYWHIPSAAHSFWEFDQVTGTYLDWLRRPIRSNFHFSFKQIADLFCIVCPWEFAWRTAPPVNSKCSTTCIKMARMEPQLWKRNTSINSKSIDEDTSFIIINACHEHELVSNITFLRILLKFSLNYFYIVTFIPIFFFLAIVSYDMRDVLHLINWNS